MTEGFEGSGELHHQGKRLCRVEVQLQAGGESSRFTHTDGTIRVVEDPDEPDTPEDLRPYEALTLVLDRPLPDGRRELSIRIEPYQGHRPDELFQIRIVD